MSHVYVNRTLNLKKIKYIGLDMDHTLIRYNSANFEALAHKVMLEKLVHEKGYPSEILALKFDFDRAIRGLVIDKLRGNVLKLSRHAAIRVSYHGLEPMDYRVQQQLYKSTYIDLGDPGIDTVDTTFSIAFAGLFLQLVDLKNKSMKETLPSYLQLANDLAVVLDLGHRDGSIKNVVRANVDRFVLKDPETIQGLEKFKRHGKKVFILTNSDFHYTKMLLDHTVNPFLKDHSSWESLFDMVITLAGKPRFFYDRLPFLKIDPQTGTMTNLETKLHSGVFQGGCAQTLTADLGLNPDEILYIGDHIYGDIVRLKKDCAWRTALVVEELESEMKKMKKAAPFVDEINKLMDEKLPLEAQLDELISTKIETGSTATSADIDRLMKQVQELDQKIKPLIIRQQEVFNPFWGEVMRTGIEESYFAFQMERFACIYMSRISDFLSMSPRTYFRSSKRLLAHDLQSQRDVD